MAIFERRRRTGVAQAPSVGERIQLALASAAAIVFGLGFATVLTLVATPSALMLGANLRAWRQARKARKLEVVEPAEPIKAAE